MITVIEARLGELAPAYEVYKETVEAIPSDAKVQIPYRPEMVADRLKALRDKISPDTTTEQFAKLREGAHHSTVSARKHALIEKGFAGTISGLFDRIMALEEIQDEAALDTLVGEIDLHRRLPEAYRLGAKVMDEHGYYYGGTFHRFEEQAS